MMEGADPQLSSFELAEISSSYRDSRSVAMVIHGDEAE